MILLDSSAVVGFLQPDDTLHGAAVDAIDAAVRAGERIAISAVTWMEILTGTMLGHREESIVRGFVSDFAIPVLPVDARIAECAARIRARHKERTADGRGRPTISPPDALILATADARADVGTIVGGDARWARACRSLDVSFARLRR